MNLTTKGRYAVTAMVDLALNGEGAAVSLNDISKRQGISLSYLEQLFSKLRRQQLVVSRRGPGGGYKLAAAAGSITFAQIITAVDEEISVMRCSGQGAEKNAGCNNGSQCLTHNLWEDLSGRIQNYLDGITLQDMITNADVMRVSKLQHNNDQTIHPTRSTGASTAGT